MSKIIIYLMYLSLFITPIYIYIYIYIYVYNLYIIRWRKFSDGRGRILTSKGISPGSAFERVNGEILPANLGFFCKYVDAARLPALAGRKLTYAGHYVTD